MSALVRFASDNDCHRALDILIDIDEGYDAASDHQIVITNRAATILRRRGVHFSIFGKRTTPAKKKPSATKARAHGAHS